MSSSKNKTVKCPNCQQESEHIVWESINVDYDPELKEKVMDGSIFDWKCPHCGSKHFLPYSFFYHDMKRSIKVYYTPDIHLEFFIEFIKIKEHGLNDAVIHRFKLDHKKFNNDDILIFNSFTNDGDLIFRLYTAENYCRFLIISKREYEDKVRKESQKQEE